MNAFTPDQWLILLLAFALGLLLGMALLANNRWKRRYRDEVARREAYEKEQTERYRALEAENERLRSERTEMDSLRHAAARDEARRRADDPGPL